MVIPLLELNIIEDAADSINEKINESITKEDKKANSGFVERRPNFKFEQMGIKISSKITLAKDNSVKVEVAENDKVIYNGLEYFLYPLTQKLQKIEYKIRPLRYWKYEGKSLDDYYNFAKRK